MSMGRKPGRPRREGPQRLPVYVTVEPHIREAIEAAARREGIPVNRWCERVLEAKVLCAPVERDWMRVASRRSVAVPTDKRLVEAGKRILSHSAPFGDPA